MTARGGGPNRTDHRFASGAFVEYGTNSPHGGDRLGEVVRENREYGQDGYLIRPLTVRPGEGYLPSTYPGRMVIEPTMSRWTRGRDGWERNYSEIKPAEPEKPTRCGCRHLFSDHDSKGCTAIMTITPVAFNESGRVACQCKRPACLWCAGSSDIVTDADSQLCRTHLAEFDGVSVAQLDAQDAAAVADLL